MRANIELKTLFQHHLIWFTSRRIEKAFLVAIEAADWNSNKLGGLISVPLL